MPGCASASECVSCDRERMRANAVVSICECERERECGRE